MSKNIIYIISQTGKTVFSLKEIALFTESANSNLLRRRLNYYVSSGKLQNPRKGFYAKNNFKIEELACKINTPSYISLDYVLQKSSVVFQYSETLTCLSYLCRTIIVNNKEISYRKIKSNVLLNTTGIERLDNGINIASTERAFLDTLYLNKESYFDNLDNINIEKCRKFLEIYNSNALNKLFYKTIQNV